MEERLPEERLFLVVEELCGHLRQFAQRDIGTDGPYHLSVGIGDCPCVAAHEQIVERSDIRLAP